VAAPAATYGLTPLQQGMLFHHLLEPAGGVDVEQLVFSLPEAVDTGLLEAAWEHATCRHAALRTAFVWEQRAEPEQVVRERVKLPWTELDWRATARDTHEGRLHALLAGDRTRGFDLGTAPLQRVTLVRLADDDYRLIWTFHHIILDGRSFTIILKEIFAEYDSLTVQTAEPPTFASHVAWVRARDLASSEQPWRERLRGFAAPTPLPMALPTPLAEGEHRDGQIEQRLGTEATRVLATWAAGHGLTLNTVVQGAWALLLSRHSGETDVVFGATRACRRSVDGADDMVGLLINTVPMRVAVNPDATLAEYLGAIRATWRGLRDLEHTPLAAVQGWSELPPGRALFDTLLVYENVLLEDVLRASGGSWANRRVTVFEQPNVPLTLGAYGGAALTLKLDHDRARIDDATATRLVAQLVTLLEGMATMPDARVADLPLLPAAERNLVLHEWNATFAPREAETIHGMFEAHARARPNAEAIRAGRVRLTYAEADARASRLATRLRAHGLMPGMIAAMCVSRTENYPLAMLAILKAGAAFLPLDPEHPTARMAHMVSDSGAHMLVTEQALASHAPSAPVTVLVDAEDDTASTDGAFAAVDPRDLAYVIYTSGSTGKPKGALLHHRGACNLARAYVSLLDLDEHSRVLQFASPSFDASVSEVLQSICLGGTLHMMPSDVLKSPHELASRITAEAITFVTLPPTLLRVLDPATMPGVRGVLSAGEAIGADIIERWGRGRQLANGYGPTETTVCATAALCDPDDRLPPTIGRPIENVRVYVLDAHGAPVPIGAPGRLWVGGVCVGSGYLNRPELTAERFARDPFAADEGARMYDTGDIARWRADGNVEFLGRVDHQLKIRGFRIEPGEVEAALLSTGRVRECTVIGREDTPGDKRLVAYVVAAPRASLDGAALLEVRDLIAAQLPPYMIPSAFVVMERLPLTSSGKVDRSRLPVPDAASLLRDRPMVAPRTPLERTLCDIWRGVLRTGRVGVEDDFFTLGGDSILMISVIARSREAGLRFSPRDVYAHPTIAALAAALPALMVADEPADDVVVDPANVPLTPVQRWFFDGETEELHHWNQAFLLTVPAGIDTVTVESAVDALVSRHEALRLRFTRTAGGWRQLIADGARAAVARVDLSNVADAGLSAEIQRECRAAHASLDIEHGPTMRVVHFDLGAARTGRLFVVVHHLAVDGVSWGVMLRELDSWLAGESSASGGRPTSFAQWAARMAAYAGSDALARELSYWEKVGRTTSIVLPRDRTVVAERDIVENANTVSVSLSQAETDDLLQRVPAAYRTQINDVLLAALARAMSGWAGDGELLIDLESHGREDLFPGLDVSSAVGWFTAMFPVAIPASRGDVGRSLREVKERLRAVPRRGVGYGALREITGLSSLREQSTPEIAFNYLGQMDQLLAGSRLLSFAREASGAWQGPRARRRHPIEINAMVRDGRLELEWSFSHQRYDDVTITRAAGTYTAALREIIAHCVSGSAFGYTPSDFPLAHLSQADVDRVIGSVRDVEDVYPLAPIQRLFHGFPDPANDPGFEQWRYRMTGALDVAALRAAWEAVVRRHPVLRTSFTGDGLSAPLQIVHRAVELPIAEHDWRSLNAEDQAARMLVLLDEDRARGFDFGQAPLMRLHVVRLADDRWDVVWSQHHLLLDRFSLPLVLREVRDVYVSRVRGSTATSGDATRVVPFRDYVAWLARQDEHVAEAFWRDTFGGYVAAPALASRIGTDCESVDGLSVEHDETGDVLVRLSTERTAELQAFASRSGLSLNTVIAGAWALWLARQLGTEDVVFGLAVAGRPAEIPGVDRMIGVTINNLPLRVSLAGAPTVRDWLRDVQRRQVDVSQYAHSPPESVQAWSGVPWRLRLFDSILVFQHGAADADNASWLGDAVRVEPVPAATHTAYPLSLVVGGTDALTFRVGRDAGHVTTQQAESAAHGLMAALTAIVADEERAVDEARATLRTPRVSEELHAARATHREQIPPRTATQWVLAKLLGDLLEIPDVGITDDFLALGGNSLLATQLASRVRDTLRVEVPVRLVFANPTVEGLAGALAARETVSGRLEKIAGVVKRVQSMTLDEVRRASAAGAVLT